jgi:basic membrane lipoprotein Med (substrate-binding protein (PBP1-ABC) superfamily)
VEILMRRMLSLPAGLSLGLMFLGGCSLVADATVKGGVGVACSADTDCQGDGATCDASKTCTLACMDADQCPSGASCVASFCRVAGTGALGAACKGSGDCASSLCTNGLCTSTCSTTPDCPGGSVCVTGSCQTSLATGFVFDNQVSNATQGFALAHELGRQAAVAELPWLQATRSENNTNDTVSGAIEDLVSGGSRVVVVTTNRFETETLEKAKAHPEVQFLTFSTTKTAKNLTSYDVRIHQAWFVAGYVSARFEAGGKIGFLGAVPLPEVVRQLNAFTLGALAANKSARVEVVWANDFVPSDDVTKKLVDYLVAGGNRVIVNRLGLGTAVSYVNELATGGKDLYSIGINNPNACDFGATSCLGSPYYNWGPLYVRTLDAIHRHTFDPTLAIDDSILVDPVQSTFQFAVNSKIAGLDGLKPDLVDLVGPGGEDLTFGGGFCVTDPAQRPGKPACAKAGELVDDAELGSMCWLVKGVVEPTDPEDPTSKLVAARAPDGSIFWPPKSIVPTSLTKPSCQ